MDVGIGLPNTVPGASGDELIEFARRAEAAGFASLGTLDRLVYAGLKPLVALAAAAAATRGIRLRTTVLLAPYRLNAALLAKEAASVQWLSGGRLTLGLGLGWREDDYRASGIAYASRGRRLDRMLAELERVWSGHEYGFAGGSAPTSRRIPRAAGRRFGGRFVPARGPLRQRLDHGRRDAAAVRRQQGEARAGLARGGA